MIAFVLIALILLIGKLINQGDIMIVIIGLSILYALSNLNQ